MRGELNTERWLVTRRDFLSATGVATFGFALSAARPTRAGEPMLRFGMVTDCHYAARGPQGTRHYAESMDKLAECVQCMNDKRADFLIELGDFKDQDSPPESEKTLAHLRRIEERFRQFKGPRFHVLGNHDVDSVSKEQFMAEVENTGIAPDRIHYSFDIKGMHGVVLDANYRKDGKPYSRGVFDWVDANIPAPQLQWLHDDLAASPGPAVVFIHQRLDGAGDVYVKNAAEVRRALEASGKVAAVFQGHHHDGGYQCIEGIHYYTLKAMVEGAGQASSSYALVEVQATGDLTVTGFRRAEGMALSMKGC